jgi:hypothetical protein
MKKKILFLAFALFALIVSPVLAATTSKLTFNYGVVGNINNTDKSVGASMSLLLKGTLTLGTPDYSSGWSNWMDEDRGWNNYGGGYDLVFSWNAQNIYPIPQWVLAQFTPEQGHQYRAHLEWNNHDHWMAHIQSWIYRWYTSKSSWSGQLVAMWNGGTSPQIFSVELTPWKVQKQVEHGRIFTSGDSWRYEHWDIYWTSTGGSEQLVGTWVNTFSFDTWCGFDYYGEILLMNFNGKFTTKGHHFGGNLFLREDKLWMNTSPPSLPSSIYVDGNGEFGPYSFQFHS